VSDARERAIQAAIEGRLNAGHIRDMALEVAYTPSDMPAVVHADCGEPCACFERGRDYEAELLSEW
jgi:hypothetical protein